MCRMLAIIPMLNSRIDSQIVMTFRELASCGMIPPGSKPGHSDGWGMVTWVDGVPTYLGREPKDAMADEKFERASEKIASFDHSSPLLVHLRKASVGLKIVSNTHPFVMGNWAFAHNGTIRKLNLKKSTDSEWFFDCLLKEFEKNSGNMTGAIEEQVRTVHSSYPYTSITFILSNGKETFVYRDCSKNLSYYGMYFTEAKDSVVVCQEKFFPSDWQVVENGQLLKFDSTGNHESLDIATSIVVSS
jgi:predicted glutamine amidotransferase